jgi:integrase
MSQPRGSKKPDKPYPEFPLTAHPNGSWCKKIRGRLHYFGPWSDPDAALAKYRAQIDDLRAGRTPQPQLQGATVAELCNQFLTHKKNQTDAGELAPTTFAFYRRVCGHAVAAFAAGTPLAALRPRDFERLRAQLAATNGPRSLTSYIQVVRLLFKFAFECDLIETPMRFGPGFSKPSKAVLRKARAGKPPRLFAAAEIGTLLAAASAPVRAMILLGINCGFGNADVARLPLTALDLGGGWVDFPRPKTGITRRCKLWPETTAALGAVLRTRPESRDPQAARLVFVRRDGRPYWRGLQISVVGHVFERLLERCGLKRAGASFYTLRHTFETVAGGARDQVAVNALMGHVDLSAAADYRELIDDDRLEAVAEHVRRWLFGE